MVSVSSSNGTDAMSEAAANAQQVVDGQQYDTVEHDFSNSNFLQTFIIIIHDAI
jgi:hypothetical protein